MKRLAIFVEGYTEVLLLERLIPQICGVHKVLIEHHGIKGGSSIPKKITKFSATHANGNEKYYVLIYNCGGDKLVAQRIIEEQKSLTDNGYIKIIGIRDVKPDFTHEQIPKIEVGLNKYIKTKLIPVEFILSVLEIETWFLSEHTHFQRIDPSLNLELIKNSLGFDPTSDDIYLRLEPQNDLNNCYGLVGKEYIKSNPATVNALDYDYIYIDLKNKIPYLNKLINSLDEFFS